jgi:agmatinase
MPRYTPEDSLQSPRFTGPSTFARLPFVRTLEEVDVAIVGVPFDTGVTYRVGGRFGPNAVRAASVMLRPYNTNLAVSPFEVLSCVDYGDVAIVPGYTERSYQAIEEAVAPIVEAGIVPLLIGGDHACTLPHLRATRSRGPVAVIDFDSHTDAWDSYFGTALDVLTGQRGLALGPGQDPLDQRPRLVVARLAHGEDGVHVDVGIDQGR